jgi:hypothetical protein
MGVGEGVDGAVQAHAGGEFGVGRRGARPAQKSASRLPAATPAECAAERCRWANKFMARPRDGMWNVSTSGSSRMEWISKGRTRFLGLLEGGASVYRGPAFSYFYGAKEKPWLKNCNT